MSERPVLVPALRELDAELAHEGMAPGARHRIASTLQTKLEARSASRRWIPMLTFACGAAFVMVVVALGAWWPPSTGPLVTAAAKPTLGSFAVEGERCRVDDWGDAQRLVGECRLVGPSMTVSTWEETSVTTRGRLVHMHRGRALFDVVKVRPGGEPVRIEVSDGTIEVVGTRFEVEQWEGSGHVDLFEGEILFHSIDGTVVGVQPGSRHAWGDRAEALTPRDDAVSDDDVVVEILDDEPKGTRTPSIKRRSPAEAAAIIDSVDKLRRSGRTSEGVALLRDAVADRWDRRTAQVLSFELGEFLYRYAGDHQGACEHFSVHQRRFPRGRYQRAVGHTLDRLECP